MIMADGIAVALSACSFQMLRGEVGIKQEKQI